MRLHYLDIDNKEIGTMQVVNGEAVATGAAKGDERLNVVEPGTLEQLTPADGDRWLEALRYEYRSGYIRAVRDSDLEALLGNASNGTQKAALSNSHLSTHKPEDQDLVEHAVGVVRSQWLRDAARLLEPREWLDELLAHDVDSIVQQISDAWDRVFQSSLPMLTDVVNEAVQRGMIFMPDTVYSVEHLKALGAEWLTAFGQTMIHRWVGDCIRRAVVGSSNLGGTPTLESQSLGIVQAVESVPDAFSIVMQPMIRRLLAFGAIMQEIERHEPLVTVQKAREKERYVIITANDDRVCKVCEYISEIGPFWLKDALDLFDNFIEAVEDGDFESELLSNEWLSEKDIVGRTRTELKRMGAIVPPFHPRCRCGVAFVRT